MTQRAKGQAAEEPTSPPDETVAGGRYLVDGVLVDAHGVPSAAPPPAAEQPQGQSGEGQ